MDIKEDIELDMAKPNKKLIRLGILISGGGTTLINILDYIKAGKLNAKVAVVICSRSKIKGVERAKEAGLEVKIIRKKDYPEITEFSNRIEEHPKRTRPRSRNLQANNNMDTNPPAK